jgi:hypothetical protein
LANPKFKERSKKMKSVQIENLLKSRRNKVEKVSAMIEELGALYMEITRDTIELREASRDFGTIELRRAHMSSFLFDGSFPERVRDALNAAMAGKYGAPMEKARISSGPLGDIGTTENMLVKVDRDHESLLCVIERYTS